MNCYNLALGQRNTEDVYYIFRGPGGRSKEKSLEGGRERKLENSTEKGEKTQDWEARGNSEFVTFTHQFY